MAPYYSPPLESQPALASLVLNVGHRLTRVHGSKYSGISFVPCTPPESSGKKRGGRFDCTSDDRFGYLYAANTAHTAVSERLLHELAPTSLDPRRLARRRYVNASITWFTVARELNLVSLRSGADLAAVGQDIWLTVGSREDYSKTRQWCTAIRRWAPWAQGLTWRSGREPDGYSYIFFGDRCDTSSFELDSTPDLSVGTLDPPSNPTDFGSADGQDFLRALLVDYRVQLV